MLTSGRLLTCCYQRVRANQHFGLDHSRRGHDLQRVLYAPARPQPLERVPVVIDRDALAGDAHRADRPALVRAGLHRGMAEIDGGGRDVHERMES